MVYTVIYRGIGRKIRLPRQSAMSMPYGLTQEFDDGLEFDESVTDEGAPDLTDQDIEDGS